MNAAPDENSSPSFELKSGEQDVDSFDEVVVLRYSRDHKPQLVEITNPLHKLIVGKVKWEFSLAAMHAETNENI